jgi:hypothetical protein
LKIVASRIRIRQHQPVLCPLLDHLLNVVTRIVGGDLKILGHDLRGFGWTKAVVEAGPNEGGEVVELADR